MEMITSKSRKAIASLDYSNYTNPPTGKTVAYVKADFDARLAADKAAQVCIVNTHASYSPADFTKQSREQHEAAGLDIKDVCETLTAGSKDGNYSQTVQAWLKLHNVKLRTAKTARVTSEEAVDA